MTGRAEASEGARDSATQGGARSLAPPRTLTVAAELDPNADIVTLRRRIAGSAPRLALTEMPDLHFLRIVVVSAAKDLRGRDLPPRVLLSLVNDGPVSAFMDRWIDRAGSELADLFAMCVGFPAGAGKSALRKWLMSRSIRPQTYYIGAVKHPMSRIREESLLYGVIQSWIDSEQQAGRCGAGDARRIHASIRAYVQTQANLPQGPWPGTPLGTWLTTAADRLKIVSMALSLPVMLALLIVPPARQSVSGFLVSVVGAVLALTALYAGILRWVERREPETVITLPDGHTARLAELEDFFLQNQFTMLSLVRDTWLRRLNLRFTLFLGNMLSRHWWNRGELVGIGTIHFARIHQIDQGRRMLFLSDFDGSWERYLFDFLAVGSFAVVPIWSHLQGCPKARFGYQPTTGFPQKFLPFTRANQIPTDLWYSARPDISMSEIMRNAQVRAGLFRSLNEREARKWLALF